MATTAAIGREWARGSCALAAMAVPPAAVLAALGLGGAGLASGDAAVAATGAVAGAAGAGVAAWRASALQARMRRDRERYVESKRALQLLIGQLRIGGRGVDLENFPDVQNPTQLVIDLTAAEPPATQLNVEPEVALDVDPEVELAAADPTAGSIPDTAPVELPARRRTVAPAFSMEIPVLSTLDEPVAQGRLAAVVELRDVPRQVTVSPLPIGELERAVYAAIAAQVAEAELATPVVAAVGAGVGQASPA